MLTWKPSPRTRGGPSNRLTREVDSVTVMTGPLWLPRFQPLARYGHDHASRTSPMAGSPDWLRTSATGSSFPTYFPAMCASLSVDTQATASSSGTAPPRAYTRLMTYRPLLPMNDRREYISSGQSRKSRLCSLMSQISNRKPSCIFSSMINPAVQNGSPNMR